MAVTKAGQVPRLSQVPARAWWSCLDSRTRCMNEDLGAVKVAQVHLVSRCYGRCMCTFSQ